MVVLFTCAATSIDAQAAAKSWKATEVWRTDGGEAGDPFSDLRSYVILKDNSLWALDFKAQNIRRYDANGKLLGNIARKGKGPGEITNANGMLVNVDNTVWVNDPSNSRFSVYNADGKFARQFVVPIRGWGFRWDAWIDVATGDVVEWLDDGANLRWRRVDKRGKVGATAPYTDCSTGSNVIESFRAESPGGAKSGSWYPFAHGGGLAPDGRGRAWCAARRATQVVLVNAMSNDTILRAQLEFPPVPVTPAERSIAIAEIEKSIARYATNDFDKSKIPTMKSGIAALHVDADSRLWVQHTSSLDRRITTFDVFDAAGKPLGRVVVPASHNPYIPIRARGNLLWMSMLDEDDVPYLIHYRLQQ